MLQRFESFEPRQLDARKETPQGKKAQQENEQRKVLRTIDNLADALSRVLDRPTDQFTELIITKHGNFDLEKRPNYYDNNINIDDNHRYTAYVTVMMHPYAKTEPHTWLTTQYVIEVVGDESSQSMRLIGHLPKSRKSSLLQHIIPIEGQITKTLGDIINQIQKHYNSIKDNFVIESFEPRKVEDRRKKVEEQNKILETLVDYKIKFNELEFLETLPVDVRKKMAHSIRESFYDVIKNEEVAQSFTDEELRTTFSKFEILDAPEDKFLAVGTRYDLCQIETQSDGIRYALLKDDEIYIFKSDVDTKVLAEALFYAAYED